MTNESAVALVGHPLGPSRTAGIDGTATGLLAGVFKLGIGENIAVTFHMGK